MRKIEIQRKIQNSKQTIGICSVYEHQRLLFSCLSMERGWHDNQRNISCIPSGEYDVELEYSNKFDKDLWEIKGVKNRSECKFHSANYWYQLNGCIALGQRLMDIDKDGYEDVTASRNTLKSFHLVLQGFTKVKLIIIDV
jgi:hypothetical protein